MKEMFLSRIIFAQNKRFKDELITKFSDPRSNFKRLDIVGTVYNLVIYMQSNKIHNVVLISKFLSALFVSSTCFGPYRSIIRSVLYKLYSLLWYVVLLCVLLQRLDVSSSTHSSTTHQSLRIQLVQNAPDDGPMRSETCRANKKCWIKLTHWDHIVYLVGLLIYNFKRLSEQFFIFLLYGTFIFKHSTHRNIEETSKIF